MAETVSITGYREFRSAIRRADKSLPGVLRSGMRDIARPIAEDAARRAKAEGLGSRAAATVKAFADARGGGIKGGTEKRVPYYGFMDFGGKRSRPKHTRKMGGKHGKSVDVAAADEPIWREVRQKGRTIYPAIAAAHDDIFASTEQLLIGVLRQAGLL